MFSFVIAGNCSTIPKVLENKLLREWDDEESPGIHADPPYLFEPKNSPPQLIDAPEKGYEIFDAEDP